MSRLAGLFGLLGLAACASTGTTPIGTNHYAPLPEGTPIAVYSRDADVKCPFEPVALLQRNDPGKYQVLTLEDAMPSLTEEARRSGANGIIIDQSSTIPSGIISRGIDVRARAIRASCAVVQ